MSGTKNFAISQILKNFVVHGMKEKKANKIVSLDLRNTKNAIADFFVICSGNSDTHIDAIADSVDKCIIKELNEKPWHIEGKTNREWVLMDYVDVVVHIFNDDKRRFYSLEEHWGDSNVIYESDENQ